MTIDDSFLDPERVNVLVSLLVGHTKFILRSPGVAGMSGCTPTSLTNLMRGICKRWALAPCDFLWQVPT